MSNISRVRVGVVLQKENDVLVVQMHRDKGAIFVLPGGGLNLGEGIFECAKREVKEETGLSVDVAKVLYLKDLVTKTDHSLEVVVLGKITKGKLTKGSDPEDKGKNVLKEVKWIPVAELKNLNFHPKQLRAILPTAFKNKFKEDATYLGK